MAIPDTIGTTYDLTYHGSERDFHVVARLDNIDDDGGLGLAYFSGYGSMTIYSDAVIDATPTDAPISGIEPI